MGEYKCCECARVHDVKCQKFGLKCLDICVRHGYSRVIT